MNARQNKLGFVLLVIGALFMVVLSALAILARVTAFDVLVIRDIHTIINTVRGFLIDGHMFFMLLFLIGLFFLTDATFKKTVKTTMKVFSIVIIITYLIYAIFYYSKSSNTSFVYDLYQTFFVVFCISFIIFLLIFEAKINYGVLILGAFILQVFKLSLPTSSGGELFKLINDIFQIFFTGLSYFLFSIYSFTKIK